MSKSEVQLIQHDCFELPESPNSNDTYRLLAREINPEYYSERTDRNIGWITAHEQVILRNSIVGIAGTGGMGGLLAATLLRSGVGEIRISDPEIFDVSNINRQYAATRESVGKSKVFETARMVRKISDDSILVVYPQGITEQTAIHFITGCHVICDEIEALVPDGRILLHQESRRQEISLFNCNTVGFGTHLFLFRPNGVKMEEAMGLTYEDAKLLRARAQKGDREAAEKIVSTIVRAVGPKVPEYRPQEQETDRQAFARRLGTGKVPIIASNPTFAAGFLADRVILYLLRNSGVHRDITEIPEPGYLFLDAAKLQASEMKGKWF